jgi:hypothetical protein
VIVPSLRRGLLLSAAAAAACIGSIAALFYHRLGLTLSHYDARGHLVVARRIFDSLTPGWQQIGAVWLPLPHLLNALPVQIDSFYRSGASAVAISVVSFAIATAAIVWLVVIVTGSTWSGIAGAVVFALNPNVLYLQATPMTEPLLICLCLLSITLLLDQLFSRALSQPTSPTLPSALSSQPSALSPHLTSSLFALACLTRYEAWPVTAIALTIACWACWRQGDSWRDAIAWTASIALFPALAIVGFTIFSRVVVGQWFASDFFVPENTALGHPYEALEQIAWGLRAMSGTALTVLGIAGMVFVAARAFTRQHSAALIVVSLAAAAAVPWLAFFQGHPYRIRYTVPLLAVEAVGAGIAAGALPRARTFSAVALILLAAIALRPFDRLAPMVVEAQWDRPNLAAREIVGSYLHTHYSGDTVMVSMGSLGHYIQDLSQEGFEIRDFLHEGNGDIWLAAIVDPRPYAGWILVEEKAEGGDMLAKIVRERPEFLKGYSRVCEGAGVALYRRE